MRQLLQLSTPEQRHSFVTDSSGRYTTALSYHSLQTSDSSFWQASCILYATLTTHYQTFDLQMLGNVYVGKNHSDEEGDHGGFCELDGMVMILLKISLSKSSILLSYDSCQNNNVSYQTMQCNVISILAYSYIGRGRRMMSALIMVRMVPW